MTSEQLKNLETRVFASTLRVGGPTKDNFDKEKFVRAAVAIQKSTEERDSDADSGNK